MVGQANRYLIMLIFVLTLFLLNSSFVFSMYLLYFTAFRAEEAVSYVGKTPLLLKTPLLQGERVAVTNLVGDIPKEEVKKF